MPIPEWLGKVLEFYNQCMVILNAATQLDGDVRCLKRIAVNAEIQALRTTQAKSGIGAITREITDIARDIDALARANQVSIADLSAAIIDLSREAHWLSKYQQALDLSADEARAGLHAPFLRIIRQMSADAEQIQGGLREVRAAFAEFTMIARKLRVVASLLKIETGRLELDGGSFSAMCETVLEVGDRVGEMATGLGAGLRGKQSTISHLRRSLDQYENAYSV